MTVSNKKIKTILAAIDFSLYSKETLKYAYEISQITGAELACINIINQRDIDTMKKVLDSKHPNTFSLIKYLPDEMERRRSKFRVLVNECGFSGKPDIKFIIDNGIPFEEILNTVNERQIDLLVIGAKGRTNVSGILFGSVAEKLFRHSPVCVMSLRPHSQSKKNGAGCF